MPSPLAHHWQLDPGITFLNHGSFGATPTCVLDVQSTYRARMEQDPVRWFVQEHEGAMDDARRRLSKTLRCPWDSLALVSNATTGVATALASLVHAGILTKGDELLATSHEYPACLNNARFWARSVGASVVLAQIPFPIASASVGLDAIERAITPRTRVALISHVTSSSGLVLPICEIVSLLRSKGVFVIADGAHAPGMIVPQSGQRSDDDDALVHLDRLGAHYYTANCHKWYCAPKGAAFLYVSPEMRERTRPIVLSNNAEAPRAGRSQFLTEFDYLGTADYTAQYSIPASIDFLTGGVVRGGIPEIARINHDLCLRGRDAILRAIGGEPCTPDDMIGSICTMRLPSAPAGALPSRLQHDVLYDRLLERHAIQVPVWSVPGADGVPVRSLRIAAQLYNTIEQYQKLADALRVELHAEQRG